MKSFRRVLTVIFTLLICFVVVPVAFAHPLGNFTINHYAGLHLTRDQIAIDFVLDMAEIWFAGFYPFITFHDPLAAATIFDPDLCSYEQGTVRVDSTDTQARTVWQPEGPNAPHQVAVTVDVDRYFEHFFSVVG